MENEENNSGNKEEAKEEDYKSKYLYLLAEADNYRKARDKEFSEYSKYAEERVIGDMLKVLDDFDSVTKIGRDEKLDSLFKSLLSVLISHGLQKMDVLGKDYSPELAEAVSTEKVSENSGKIIEEIQPGYMLNGKVIRYPKVKITV